MIHFASRIDTDNRTYTAACGYVGYNPEMFTDIHGKVKKKLGGRVTCPNCIVKIVRKIVERIEGTHDY